ncbi:MAG: hypothetical protein KTR32_09795 [Granulosicoccus sp.]|nr:hypothetical protein [Granulosicoccus sp.]
MNTDCINNVNCVTQTQDQIFATNGWLFRKLIDLLNNVQKKIRQRRELRISRDAMARLNELDDSTLRDIGLTKGDVIWASRLPLSVNAATELKIIADQRRQQRF